MVNVKKRAGATEEFMESKITAGVKKAGATAEEAARVTKDVTAKTARMTVVEAEKLSDMVVESLKTVNKTAADGFHKFRTEKYENR